MDTPADGAAGSFEEEDGTVLSSDEIECPDWLHELENESRYEGDVRPLVLCIHSPNPLGCIFALCVSLMAAVSWPHPSDFRKH